MNFEKNNIFKAPKKILIAPLDWGLGHATRCIPIIYDILNLNIAVWIAAEGPIKALLQKELPQVQFIPLAGYKIRYGKGRLHTIFTLLWQLPYILGTIKKEQRWLQQIVREHEFDMIISDNRPGLYHTAIPTVYITHQLYINTSNSITAWLAQQLHYRFINKFTDCWVPDVKEDNNLAGKLSHPVKMPKTPVHYIGALSRLQKINTTKQTDLLILLSGPEPQRTIFENIVMQQLQAYKGVAVLIRGLPDSTDTLQHTITKLTVHNHLATAALGTYMQQAKMIICRSGYTTVMDLIALQQKAILVPTPGQTEQEYLAQYLTAQKIFYSIPQHQFSIATALQAAAAFSFTASSITVNNYKGRVEALIQSLLQQNQ
jgi:uncharacterized protein (TIGR00661 family)